MNEPSGTRPSKLSFVFTLNAIKSNETLIFLLLFGLLVRHVFWNVIKFASVISGESAIIVKGFYLLAISTAELLSVV